MITNCAICGTEIELDIDEFIQVEQEPDDYYCDDCAAIIYQGVIRIYTFDAN